MSYTYLQEAGEESSVECFSDIARCVEWKLNLTADGRSCKDNAKESCLGSPFGTMSEPLTERRGKELPTSSAEVSHAKTLAVLEQPQETKGSMRNVADSGGTCAESLAKYDPATFSWKTRQCSLFEGLEPFSDAWPRWGMMQDGELYPLHPAVPPISESAFGYLPTPDASLGMFDAAAEMDLVSCFRKETTGMRPSGAKIGSSLRWHPEFIYEWQRTGGELNAEWIEALMGWPIGWTACAPLETARFQQWLNSHGKS